MAGGLDRVTLEVIRHAAVMISEEMGVVLGGSAYSPNIRDRLDYSCAILTPQGDLVAQAEHIPVHLGSMAVGARATIEWLERQGLTLEPGDVVVTNDPYIAGTHLNDFLMIKPVYHGGELVAIVVSKAHYVDVGGLVPGSLSPAARSLREEGLVVPPVKLVEAGRVRWDVVELLAANVRTPEYLRGDVRAQLASLNVGERRVRELAAKYGARALLEAWSEILAYTERYARRRIGELGPHGSYTAVDYLELPDGGEAAVRATVTFRGDSVKVDFAGSSPQVPHPLNAVYGVTVAAATYALKTVLDPEMPVNQGFYRAVEIEAPEGSIVNPRRPAPVGAGNTETSQRIVDVVYLALSKAVPGRVPAASCGTMTNVMLGGEGWAFYETIACGQGARPGLDGVDGVHTNMTNTLNTPIERMEAEYPLLFLEYRLRGDSEGPGTYRGGLGVTRAFKLTRGRAVLTVVSERCRRRPWGLEGGRSGEPSRHYIVRADGSVEELPCKATVELTEGDSVYINTPGGGGYGDPCRRPSSLVEEDVAEGKITPARAAREYCWPRSAT